MTGDRHGERPPGNHEAVLLAEAVAALVVRVDGTYVDATFGRGGHCRAILGALGARGRVFAFDRDPQAAFAAAQIADPRLRFLCLRFSETAAALHAAGVAGVDGALLDLGVSSPQLDDPARGFSIRRDGPLDMRMDPEHGRSAAEWLADAPEDEIRRVIAEYGEERAAGPIARAIVAARAREPFTTTGRLAAVVAGAVRRARPGRREDIDPATRTFQAIRIHVNEELAELALGLDRLLPMLNPGGRLVVISFHSLEDRVVKRFIREHSGRAPVDPRLARLPVMPARARALLAPIGRLVRPGDAECRRNPRARSARMRVAERTAESA